MHNNLYHKERQKRFFSLNFQSFSWMFFLSSPICKINQSEIKVIKIMTFGKVNT